MRRTLFLAMVLPQQQQQGSAWTWTSHSNSGSAPRVSGHSAASSQDDNRVFVFGGLTGNAGSPCTQDLWAFEDGKWNQVDTGSGPGPRMYSAAAMLNNNDLYLLGGWDPGAPKSGGTFLDDVWHLDGKTMKWTLTDEKLPCGPVSRHAACTVGDKIILHTFRGVCTFDGKTWTEQATTGTAPEELSMCAMTPLSDSSLLVFGGSTKTQQLSSDAFVLDTNTWEWTKLDTDEDGPSPRASPCAAQCGDNQAIVFGGASLGAGGYEGGAGLQAQGDTWLLTVGDNHKACWDRIDFKDDKSPSARLAASLSRTGEEGLLLQGGWDPKGETFEDTWVLEK